MSTSAELIEKLQGVVAEVVEQLIATEREKQNARCDTTFNVYRTVSTGEFAKVATQIEKSLQSHVNLNIGGKQFTTSVQTLKSCTGSYFDVLLSGKWEVKDTIFVDRNPSVFKFVLDFLRGEKVPVDLLTPLQCLQLEKDAEFYQLPTLKDLFAKNTFSTTHKSPSVIYSEGNSVVELQSTGHAFVLGVRNIREGVHKFRFHILLLPAGHWVLFGICAGIPQNAPSYGHLANYGWAGGNQVYVGGINNPGKDGYITDFDSGNIITLTVDCFQNQLSYANETKNKKYQMEIPAGKVWNLHLCLYNSGDKIKLL